MMDDDGEFVLTYGDRDKIAQLLQRYQNLSSDAPLSSATRCYSIDPTSPTFLSELFQELENIDVEDLTREGTAKNFGDFLVDLTATVPLIVLDSINYLLPHLDGEYYGLRNAILTILAELIEHRLKGEQLSNDEKELRDKFLQHLENHLHDKNAFVRSKVLQLWVKLAESKSIPLSRLNTVLPLIVGRLADKASTVRKAAVHFLTAILKGNPFMAEFKLDEVKAKYEMENAKLQQMLEDQKRQRAIDADHRLIARAEDSWNRLEPQLKSEVKRWLKENWMEGELFSTSAELSQDASADILLKGIYLLLTDSKFMEACSFVVAAQAHYPDHRVFMEWTANEENVNCGTMKSSILESLKTIYLEHTVAKGTTSEDSADEEMNDSNSSGSEDLDYSRAVCSQPVGSQNEHQEIARQHHLVQYLRAACKFAEQLLAVLPQISAMLRQQQTSDVLEAIEFIVTCHEFGINGSDVALWECCRLIWSKEQPVKDAVIRTFKRLFLSPAAEDERSGAVSIVKNLVILAMRADLSQLTSLEEIICELFKRQHLPATVCQILWEFFSMRFAGGNSYQESKAALKLIGMMTKAEKSVVRDNMDILIEFGLGDRASRDFELAMDACYALEKLSLMPKAKAEEALKTEPCRFNDDHDLFKSIRVLIVDGYCRLEDQFWTPMVERAMHVVFSLADNPNEVAVAILKDVLALFRQRSGTDGVNGRLLRLLVLIGQVALQAFINLDVAVCRELKRRNLLTEEARLKLRAKTIQKKATTSIADTPLVRGGRQLPIKTPRAKVSIVTTSVTPTNDVDDDLSAMVGATADDQEYEFVYRLCEDELLKDGSILGQLSAVVLLVCQNPHKYPNEDIQTAAALALSKLMLVSSKFAEANIQLFFTLMDRSDSATVRANLVIAVGDLSFRFPNLVEPWTATVYQRLHDRDLNVRLNCLLILNHLILNDMIKPKGFVADIALCSLDGNIHVTNLAKKFFVEYAEKGNALYNLLPDIISRLSDSASKVGLDDFKTILKFLFSLIRKERQFESLVEKLCQRFIIASSYDQCRRLSYCLTLLPFNERCLRKLQENSHCFANKLGDDGIYCDFVAIMNAARKACKQESKELLDEFEEKIMSLHRKYEVENERNAIESMEIDVLPARELAKTPRRRRHVTIASPADAAACSKKRSPQRSDRNRRSDD